MTHCHTRILAVTSLAALTTLLAACSGSSNSEPPPTPQPPAGTIQLAFRQPLVNVVEPGSSQALSVDVTLGANAAPDGTAVTFTVAPSGLASTAPTAANTLQGSASTTLSTATAAPGSTFAVNATVRSTSNAASATVNFFVRPQHSPMQVMVPIYPAAAASSSSSSSSTSSSTTSGTGSTTAATAWGSLANSAASYPDVQIVAIANPNAGTLTATTTADATLGTDITTFKAVAGTRNKVLGYVATASGSSGPISVADAKTTIDNYIRLYPNQLDGFFLDNMGTDSAHLSYYQDIYNHIKAITAGLATTSPATPLVIGNPSTYPVQAYASVADTLVTFAGSAAAYQGIQPQPANTWIYARNNLAQAAMVHSTTTCTDMQRVVQAANSPLMNTGYIYVTNMSSGAPWATLPTYWLQLLSTVDAINKQIVLPAC